MKNISTLLLAVALLAAGCGASKRIDTTSEETTKNSMEAIKKSLSAAEQEKFEAAVMTIGAKHIFGSMLKDTAEGEKEAKKALHGKTAAEVIAEAEKIRSENKK